VKKILKRILVLALLCVFVYSGLQVYRMVGAYAQAEEQYTRLEQYVSVPAVPSASAPPSDGEAAEEPEREPPAWPEADFAALGSINPDIVGWLTVEGTRIHYPVVRGTDNEFYLNHRFDGKRSGGGCLFLDAENSAGFDETNQIIYGHYMKDHSMFYDLGGYKRQAFYDAHPTGWLVTPTAVYRLRFFSGYVSDTEGEAWKRVFSGEEYAAWLEERVEKSAFFSDVVPAAEDRILTLSTCSYEFEDARFVLHAVMEQQVTG